MSTGDPSGPYRLVTVNTAPERAKVIIGRVVEAVRERYTIDYLANAEGMVVCSSLILLLDSARLCLNVFCFWIGTADDY
jgi:hypothetical protein